MVRLRDRLPPFPPGKVAGGPNSGIQDPIAQANLQGCAPQACYIDHNGSWLTNETTINWNAALAWYASWAADMGTGVPEPPQTCQVSYTVHGSWPGGFNVQIWIENLGDEPINGWTLSWRFAGGQSIRNGWSATYHQSDATITADNLPWNAVLGEVGGRNSRTTIGFIGTGVPRRGIASSLLIANGIDRSPSTGCRSGYS